MQKSKIQIVWFKRDLRTTDHKPLFEASKTLKPILPIYVVENEYWKQPFSNKRHWCFIYDSLIELRKELKKLGQSLIVRIGSVTDILNELSNQFNIISIFSHEETGNQWTYDRDLNVKNWCNEKNISLIEYPTNGIVRNLKNRDDWAKIRNLRMKENLIPKPVSLMPFNGILEGSIPNKNSPIFKNDFNGEVQKGGRSEALKIIQSFIKDRGQNYLFNISKPGISEKTCSRISPHLTWGTISSKEIIKLLNLNKTNSQQKISTISNKNLNAIKSRLSWRCHFIQKLESQPSIETSCMHPFYDKLRKDNMNIDYYKAWKEGLTGYPFIDACMRSLNYNGWITFRMRAMLVSFASYDLWLDWRKTGHHLAQTFTDYEPGIHYSQLQMQSGVTGINTLRIYNPIKQSMDHDINGKFIKKWVHELRNIPEIWIHEPWKMDLETQENVNCLIGKHYPKPIVDHTTAIRDAKAKISSIFLKEGYRKKSNMIFEKLGSRTRTKSSKKRNNQLQLI